MDAVEYDKYLVASLNLFYVVAFFLPVFSYAFDKSLVSHKVAKLIFYVCSSWWIYILAGTDQSTRQVFAAFSAFFLYAPGFIAIIRYKRQANHAG